MGLRVENAWNGAAHAGLFAVDLNVRRAAANTNYGARPASGEGQKRQTYGPDGSTPPKGCASLGNGKPPEPEE